MPLILFVWYLIRRFAINIRQITTARVPPIRSENKTTGILALEAEIDRLVYAVYCLAEEEIALVEGRN